ncbi:MAG: PaaI family thioesterase [Amnibacterium sp.]
MSYLRPVLPSAGPLTATGTVVKRGRRVAFAEAVLTDAAGTAYASATSSLLVIGPKG